LQNSATRFAERGNGNVKLGHAAVRSGKWAQHFSNASCLFYFFYSWYEVVSKHEQVDVSNHADFALANNPPVFN